MRKQFALTATDSSGFCVYFIKSPNGDFMGRSAYSVAARFESIAAARKNIPFMSSRYLGLSNWKAMQVID